MTILVGVCLGLCSVVSLAWGIVTEFRQMKERGPIGIAPTLPFGLMSAFYLTVGLMFVREKILVTAPVCLLAGLLFGVVAVALITAAGRIGRACRPPEPRDMLPRDRPA